MDDREIDRLVAEKLARLRQRLERLFGEDAGKTADMLIAALDRQFGGIPIREEDQRHYLEALARLPRGSTVRPFALASLDTRAADPDFCISFWQSGGEYRSSKRFVTKAEAEEYGRQYLRTLFCEINRA
jgi:hypothetical protein